MQELMDWIEHREELLEELVESEGVESSDAKLDPSPPSSAPDTPPSSSSSQPPK